MRKAKKFYYGGQAVIEGVMMMGPKGYAVSARRPDGSIATKIEPHHSVREKMKWMGWPIIRGFVNLCEMLVLGMSTITWSANQAGEDEEELNGGEMALAILIALVACVALFLVVPAWFGTMAYHYVGGFGRSLLEGIIRIAIFIIYLLIIRKMDDIMRVFRYHGAEHKTINAYEAGEVLTPERVAAYSTRHLRCGTSFVLMVMIMMIIIFTFIGQTESTWTRVLIKLACMPFVAGLTYEFTRWSARHCENKCVRILITPGLWLQALTTEEPELDMLAVAIRSLKAVIPGYFDEHPDEEPIIDYRIEEKKESEAAEEIFNVQNGAEELD